MSGTEGKNWQQWDCIPYPKNHFADFNQFAGIYHLGMFKGYGVLDLILCIEQELPKFNKNLLLCTVSPEKLDIKSLRDFPWPDLGPNIGPFPIQK